MSIDYSDMAFPKPGKKKKRKIHKKSILNSQKGICYLCARLNGDYSVKQTVKTFRYMWDGMMQGKSVDEGWIQKGNKKTNEHRIHPTQKPIDLYRWIAREYIKPGWNVLDTHTGSASSLIAYHEAGIRYVGFEINEKMYQKARKRLKEVENQLSIFDLGVKR